MKGFNKPLLYLFGTIFIFAVFIYILLRPSTQSKAIKEIETCLNTEDVKAVWYKYRSDLSDDEDYCQAVRDKLKTFNLKQSEITEIKKWLPSKTQNLNIILVPDLSYRINDKKNNPEQMKNDTALLNTVWKLFEKKVRLKMNSKDRLVVDIADPEQGQGQFKTIADSLVFDLSDFKNKSNRLYFNSIQGRFESNIKQLYNLAKQKTTGANYVYFFAEKLQSRIKKSTLDDDFRNVVILITDGYLELTMKDGSATSISPPIDALRKYCMTGNNSSFKYPMQTVDITYPDVEVYLFEVNERQSGQGCDFKGLKRWWTDWFKAMQIKNSDEEFIFRRQEAIILSKKEIENIFEHK
jgi:hypothetical protein